MSLSHKIVLGLLVAAGLAILTAAFLSVGRSGSVRARPAVRPVTPARLHTPGLRSDAAQHLREMPPPEGRWGSISGNVWTSTGAPAHDAVITAVTFDGVPRIAGQTRTDVEGRFLLTQLTPAVYTIQAESSGSFAFRDGVVVDPDQTTPMSALFLRAGKSFRLLILDPRRAPASGVTVRVGRIHSRSERSAYDVLVAELSTDAAGRFELPPLPDGAYRLQAFRTVVENGLKQLRDSETHEFEIAGGTLSAKILWPGDPERSRAELEILDGSGHPVQGAWAAAYRVQYRPRFSFGILEDEVTTDARGRAVLALRHSGSHCAVVLSGGGSFFRPFRALAGGLYEIENQNGKPIPIGPRVVGRIGP